MPFLRFLALAILAVWLGGLLILGTIAAPMLFAVLEEHDPIAGRTLAAVAFGAIFQRFETVSWLLGVLFIAVLIVRAALGPRPRRLAVRIWTASVMVAIAIVTTAYIAPRIDKIRRETTGTVAALRLDDPRRVEFTRLHNLSNILGLVTVLAGVWLLWCEAKDGVT